MRRLARSGNDSSTRARARVLVDSASGDEGFTSTAAVLQIDARDVTAAVTEEAFGPLIVIARYDDLDQVRVALRAVPDSLTDDHPQRTR